MHTSEATLIVEHQLKSTLVALVQSLFGKGSRFNPCIVLLRNTFVTVICFTGESQKRDLASKKL